MELVAGYPYWLIKSGLPYQYPKNGITVSFEAAEIITDLLMGRKTKMPLFFLFQGDHITFTFTKSGFFSNWRLYLKRIFVLNSSRQLSPSKFF
jgi:hypothetical protein